MEIRTSTRVERRCIIELQNENVTVDLYNQLKHLDYLVKSKLDMYAVRDLIEALEVELKQ